MGYTAEQKIKYWIIEYLIDYESLSITDEITPETIDEIYENIEDFGDAINETRCSGIESNIQPEYSRHYESKSIARQFSDGSWVGWTYWYGGGKYGCPEEIDWISDAYDLSAKEEEVTIIKRTFTKR